GPVPLPDWAQRPAPPAFAAPGPLSPSSLGGAKVLPGEADPALAEAALARGRALHLLLEHLPGLPRADWPARAQALAGPAAQPLLEEARAILDAPDLAPLFGPDTLAEVPLTGTLLGRRALGVIDRLVVGPDRVLAVDIKSNRLVPDRPETVPEGLLRQMGAYAALLAPLFPGRQIDTALLWTATPRLMPLPGALVMAALQRAEVA
ncbi:MAG: double-strand break repair helicase AddA, partial [Rhodobacterales bacterium]|nr:double-strand break repair helicase AddA [Rhodobacterales bacterium]